MEFQNTYMEKSWKKILALRAFDPILTLHLAYYECSNFIISVVYGYNEMQ